MRNRDEFSDLNDSVKLLLKKSGEVLQEWDDDLEKWFKWIWTSRKYSRGSTKLHNAAIHLIARMGVELRRW